MMTYEYECQKCGHKFELMQKMSDKPAEKCPKCEGRIKRLISGGAGFLLKGKGSNADFGAGPSCQDGSCDMRGSCEGGSCPMGNFGE